MNTSNTYFGQLILMGLLWVAFVVTTSIKSPPFVGFFGGIFLLLVAMIFLAVRAHGLGAPRFGLLTSAAFMVGAFLIFFFGTRVYHKIDHLTLAKDAVTACEKVGYPGYAAKDETTFACAAHGVADNWVGPVWCPMVESCSRDTVIGWLGIDSCSRYDPDWVWCYAT